MSTSPKNASEGGFLPSGALRRLGLIGDIHGEDVLLERTLEVLSGRGLDTIVATGVSRTGWARSLAAASSSSETVAPAGY
jgi:hypothetical protein